MNRDFRLDRSRFPLKGKKWVVLIGGSGEGALHGYRVLGGVAEHSYTNGNGVFGMAVLEDSEWEHGSVELAIAWGYSISRGRDLQKGSRKRGVPEATNCTYPLEAHLT
jgi:hypothetical protein